MNKTDWKDCMIDRKKWIPYVVAVGLFLTIAVVYCAPLLDGKVLQATDATTMKGAAEEALQYKKQTGETTWWTNSMFGGMPTYQIVGSLPSNDLTIHLHKIANAFFIGDFRPMGMLFAYFMGFFLLLLCCGVNPWLSLIGGLAMGLSSYFFLIIPAGHMTKADAIAFLAPMIGGFIAVFRKKYCLGAPLFTLYGILGITLHPQMTYYMCMLLGLLALAELYTHIVEKRWKDLGIGVGILLVCGLLIFGTKMSWWQMNREYLQETMRGGHSELAQVEDDDQTLNSDGLDIKYATEWSYGKAETLTLLIPNMMGGSSAYNVGEKSVLHERMVKAHKPKGAIKQHCQRVCTYWGEKKFTYGPTYVGAIVCFLFVLGLIIVPGVYKWALLAATIFSILLAWGKNFMPLSELFFNYFPMYNKFRAVESILVVAEIAMPLLGILGLKRLLEEENKNVFVRPLYIAAGVTAGLCLFIALFGGILFDFTSSYDAQWKDKAGDMYGMILDQRAAMLKADAWRSFLFIVLAAGVLWIYLMDKLKKRYVYAMLGVLIVADMVPVDRRFFGKQHFVNQTDDAKIFAMQSWEEYILQDKSLDYRVLNMMTKPFRDSRTSYRLKSIGGYSAAKLRRYNDLINAHILRNNRQVIDMLNTKYVYMHDSIYTNADAFGNAWFVDSLMCVNTADAESEALNTLDLRRVAVTDTTFAANKALAKIRVGGGQSMIEMTDYQPNKLTYKAETDVERMVVFSEIYYPHDWHLCVDGEELPIYRVNYTLRAAMVPQGKHEIVMQFVPSALKTDKWCVACIILSLIVAIVILLIYSLNFVDYIAMLSVDER